MIEESIVGEVHVCRGIPRSIGKTNLYFLSVRNPDIDVKRFLTEDEPTVIKNRILHTGKKLFLHKMFFDADYTFGRIYAGDGAALFFNDEPYQYSFPNESFPETNIIVRNEVFRNVAGSFGEIVDLDGERSRGFAALIQSDLHQTGVFDPSNGNFQINNLSLAATGTGLPAIGDFDGSGDIPVSNATIPGMEMDPADPTVLYINWIFRLI